MQVKLQVRYDRIPLVAENLTVVKSMESKALALKCQQEMAANMELAKSATWLSSIRISSESLSSPSASSSLSCINLPFRDGELWTGSSLSLGIRPSREYSSRATGFSAEDSHKPRELTLEVACKGRLSAGNVPSLSECWGHNEVTKISSYEVQRHGPN